MMVNSGSSWYYQATVAAVDEEPCVGMPGSCLSQQRLQGLGEFCRAAMLCYPIELQVHDKTPILGPKYTQIHTLYIYIYNMYTYMYTYKCTHAYTYI